MVTRRFKKGSIYDALAHTTGLEFSPVIHNTFNRREETSSSQAPKPPDIIQEKPAKLQHELAAKFQSLGLTDPNDSVFYKEKPNQNKGNTSPKPLTTPLSSQDSAAPFHGNTKSEGMKEPEEECLSAHEKYPSWPVTTATSSSVSSRSHSWNGQTDYPKEKVAYIRPKKANQFKISTSQLQPVLERAPDYNLNKNSPESFGSTNRKNSAENFNVQYPSSSSGAESKDKQFDFDGFHTPSIPQCYYNDKEYGHNQSSDRDTASASASTSTTASCASGVREDTSTESNGFLSRYEDVLCHQAQYSVPLSSTSSKQRNIDNKGMPPGPDTPFLDRLRLENAWQMPPPPIPIIPAAVAPQHLQPPGNDFELSSDNGTWMGSMESSSHGRGLPKWQGSYSDLSTLSTQLSNRSSLFDSGHSTMPESGRLSPQSSCDSTAPSLLLEAPTRAQVIARHGCHREIVAHSARVQQPERHGSESIVYYATGSSSRMNGESKAGSKKIDPEVASGSNPAGETMYRSQTSLTLSPSQSKTSVPKLPDCQNKSTKCPSRQDSRKSSNSFSSEDSYPRARSHCGEDTSGSSSDVSNVTCISNYKTASKSKSFKEPSPVRELKPSKIDPHFNKYNTNFEPPKSKGMDETARKYVFPDADKKQRASDPELKAIQKQAVLSFYQRMSMAESVKIDPIQPAPGPVSPENEGPPPYEATPSRINMFPSKLSLMPKGLNKPWETRGSNQPISAPNHLPPPKPAESALLNHHSKSVPNLVLLKGQNLDVPTGNPIFKRYAGSQIIDPNRNNNQQVNLKRGSPLAREETISWDELPNVLEKKREAMEKAALANENKDPKDDNGACSSGMHYFKAHKSPRKVHLKEVHHSNETASVKVMTPDGVTLVQTHEQRRDDKLGVAPIPPHKRRPAPPPPPKQPPKRPPPPPPPVTPPPQVVVVVNGNDTEIGENVGELRVDIKAPSKTSASTSQLMQNRALPPIPSCSTPDVPLPPPPQVQSREIVNPNDEPLPPPPTESDVNAQPRSLDSSSLIYPKNSYMSYRSERKLGRYGFDGKYRRSFNTSASSVDLTTLGSSFPEGPTPKSWEQKHNIRQHGTTVIFHSNCLQPESRLQRSSSQECGPIEEPTSAESNNISNGNSQESRNNQSETSINFQSSNNQGVPSQSVPYCPASHDNKNSDAQNSSSDSHQNDIANVASSPIPDNTVQNCDITPDDSSILDNRTFNDDSFIESDTSVIINVDHNQNTVENGDNSNLEVIHESDANGIDNAASQTVDHPRLSHVYTKTKEELECEQLSLDYVNCCGDEATESLIDVLVPSPNRRTMSDYMEGLLNLELGTNGQPSHRRPLANSLLQNQNQQNEKKGNETDNESNDTDNESNDTNLKSESNDNKELNENECAEREANLKQKREELLQSIQRKINILRNEQSEIREEVVQNELLGQEIFSNLQKHAKPNELEKYSLHVEEIEKIINLLLSLSARLARVENTLKNLPKDSDKKKMFESRREKLREQHEDARRLKESIDRRSNQVSTFLHEYFSDEEYANYDRFIKVKAKLIVDFREIEEKVILSEEQLATLSVVVQFLKSANS